jgi:hypothetical protein
MKLVGGDAFEGCCVNEDQILPPVDRPVSVSMLVFFLPLRTVAGWIMANQSVSEAGFQVLVCRVTTSHLSEHSLASQQHAFCVCAR